MAAVALVQPWLLRLWRRYFRAGTLDVHETGEIEVGYAAGGPTIGLHGTLRAVHRDIFVRDARLIVRRLRDESRHVFDWVLLQAGTTADVPAAFLVAQSQAHRYHIVFADVVTREEIRRVQHPVLQEWTDLLVANPPADEAARYALYEPFSQTPVHFNAHAELTRLSYWDPGDYELRMQINSTRPNQAFVRAWRFTLTQEDADRLRLNAIPMLRELAGFRDIPFQFALPLYLAPESG